MCLFVFFSSLFLFLVNCCIIDKNNWAITVENNINEKLLVKRELILYSTLDYREYIVITADAIFDGNNIIPPTVTNIFISPNKESQEELKNNYPMFYAMKKVLTEKIMEALSNLYEKSNRIVDMLDKLPIPRIPNEIIESE